MSEEKKSIGKGHINLFDVMLVLLVILCIVGVWQRKNLQAWFEEERINDVYTVSFEIKELRDTSIRYLTAGTSLYVIDGEDAVSLGTIAGEVAVVDAAKHLPHTDESGQTVLVEAYYPDDLSTVKAVLNCHGIHTNGSFFVDGRFAVSVGQTLAVYTENADFEIYVTDITKVG